MNTYDDGFRYGFLRGRANAAIDLEEQRRRQSELHKPFTGNAPELLKMTRCKVLKAFYIGGKVADVGAIVELTAFDARSLAAIKKCEIVA